ncbi:2,3-bisphosphoglycerate-independent phosphoglycerate mutase, partial [Acidobacteria bacterium AH-259-D05]|nr:2,3-bisphosphoglycerate-independent phosphoglycerate mutase [Acidobacteria bacterium AH-259-D05]
GLSDLKEGNAMAKAQLPTLEKLFSRYPWVTLEASGTRVGLPEGQMGNSEVGHLNIGAGRVVYQDITRINQSIESGDFFTYENVRHILEVARNGALHLLGLVSDGGVHSHLRHLFALLRFAKQEDVKEVFIHAFTDGRDTSPKGGIDYLRQLLEETERIGIGRIASVSGRYYSMDRDNRWQRTEKAYRAIVEGVCDATFADPLEGIRHSYRGDVTDEFIVPFAVVDENGKPVGQLEEKHAAIFFNFRADRARQLTRALTLEEFPSFTRSRKPLQHLLTMTEYDKEFGLPKAFAPIRLEQILVKLLSQRKIRNLRLAETEKYAHVTYFFNGGEEQPFDREERVLIPSPQVSTYDLKPEMSAFEITDQLLDAIDTGSYETVILNFANADMVGHTGVLEAAVKAVEVVDTCVGRIYQKIKKLGGVMMVTADHGNAEQMIDPATGRIHTAHTSNPVPFILVDDHYRQKLRGGGALEDIAPTVLHYLEIGKPPEMTGNSLLILD